MYVPKLSNILNSNILEYSVAADLITYLSDCIKYIIIMQSFVFGD